MMKRALTFVICIMMLTMSFNIVSFADTDAEVNLAADVMTKEVFEASNGISMPYRLYVPSGYSVEKEYSFLLFLHGAGNRGNDNESQVSVTFKIPASLVLCEGDATLCKDADNYYLTVSAGGFGFIKF